MKTIFIVLAVLLVYLSTTAQELKKKKLLLNLNVMGQGVTQNYEAGTAPYFEDSNTNIDVHFKIGRYLFKEKATVGFGLNFRAVNNTKYISPRPPVEEFDPEIHYIETTELQLGIFSRYKIYDELFVEGYAGFFGWVFRGRFFPSGPIGSIIKYKVGLATLLMFGTFCWFSH
jgi:hypothetical protein